MNDSLDEIIRPHASFVFQIMLIDGRDQETREENKRKRPDSNQGDLNVSRSLSQLSISRANQPKKKQKKKMKKKVPTTTAEQSSERQPSKTKQKKKDRTLKSRYLQVSDQIFKEMLSNAIQGGEQLVQCLNTAEKLQFIRRITGLIDQIQYFDLQRHLWNDYYKLGMKEGEWAPRVSKSFAQQHQICRTYGYPRRIIEKRQKTVQHQLERTIHELHLCQEELEQHSKQWEPSFDPNHLSQAMIDCVKKGQRRLQEEFEHRRKNLEFDAKEHQLIRTFYQCEPNAEQVCAMDDYVE